MGLHFNDFGFDFLPLFKCALAKLADRTCSFLVDVINILTSNAFGAQKNRQYS